MFWNGRYRKNGLVDSFMRPRNSTAAPLSSVAELVWLAVGSGEETPLLPGAGPDLNQS